MLASAFTYTFRSGVPPPFFSLRRNEYTMPLAVTRLRLVEAPSLAGFTWAMFCAALMTQKSLSPQTTSRISSPSGNTIIVVYRRRVWSGIRLRADADTSRVATAWPDIDVGTEPNAPATTKLGTRNRRADIRHLRP